MLHCSYHNKIQSVRANTLLSCPNCSKNEAVSGATFVDEEGVRVGWLIFASMKDWKTHSVIHIFSTVAYSLERHIPTLIRYLSAVHILVFNEYSLSHIYLQATHIKVSLNTNDEYSTYSSSSSMHISVSRA